MGLSALRKNPNLALVYHIWNKAKNVRLLSGIFGKTEIELFVRMRLMGFEIIGTQAQDASPKRD